VSMTAVGASGRRSVALAFGVIGCVMKQLWSRRWFRFAAGATALLAGSLVFLCWYFGIGTPREPPLRERLLGRWLFTSKNTWVEFKADGTYDAQFIIANAEGERAETVLTSQYRWLDDEHIERKSSPGESLRAMGLDKAIDWNKLDEKAKSAIAGPEVEKAKVVLTGEDLSLLYESGKVERFKRVK
jgi:hypothetical protein